MNLFLHVGAPGADGYHPLCSLMAFADVGDRLSASASQTLSLRLKGEFGHALAGEGDNLVLRAGRALLAAAGAVSPPLELILEKQLPVASGLGGGSSDAGAALRLLREVLRLSVDDAALQAIAAELGADGAACLWGRPVIAEGRGERLSPAPGFPAVNAVLVNPGVPVSTPAVYRAFDAAGAFGAVEPPRAPRTFDRAQDLAAWLAGQRNDLQAASIAVAPAVGEVLEQLEAQSESLLARVSGSGGTCFALCPTPEQAEALSARIAASRPGWWVKRCRLGGPWPDA